MPRKKRQRNVTGEKKRNAHKEKMANVRAKMPLNEEDSAPDDLSVLFEELNLCESSPAETSNVMSPSTPVPPQHRYNLRNRKAVNYAPIIVQDVRRTYKVALEENAHVSGHSVGRFATKCCFCKAAHFPDEKTGTTPGFTSCCHKEKVKLVPLQRSTFIEDLLSNDDYLSRDFKSNIRSYNAAHAMVSMKAEVTNADPNGPPFFKIHGMVYHRIGGLLPNEDTTPIYNQLYIYDVDKAVEERLRHPANSACSFELMEKLSKYFHEENLYAQQFKSMYEAMKQPDGSLKYDDLFMYIITDKSQDQRRFNKPVTSNEVAVVFRAEDGAPPSERGLFIYPRRDTAQRISVLNPALDPMAYPILFPRGDLGWSPSLSHVQGHTSGQRQKVTMLQYASYRLAVRDGFSILHNSQKLFLQYIVDMYTRIEGCRLDYIRNNQKDLRVDYYFNVLDYVRNKSEELRLPIGKVHILPSSFKGSPRQMLESYQDAMAIVRKYGKPDLFITMTCNPNWPEIRNTLRKDQNAWERPDIVSRVFHCKLQALISEIRKGEIFGHVSALIYTIEFQKRGLPHAHILVSLTEEDKIREMDEVDKIVCAEIPDHEQDPELFEIVKTHMIHGPCGLLNPTAPCMQNNKCSKNFPKAFSDTTRDVGKGYPTYRRRNDGRFVQKGNVCFDNRMVVPYNRYLSLRYNCHINVEVCATVKGVKYIYKYAYKGYDACTLVVSKSEKECAYDEIQSYLTGRYISSHEAVWRIFEYEMHFQSHSVVKLECHLEMQNRIYFEEGDEENAAAKSYTTKLLGWFKLNSEDPSARHLLYTDIPLKYVWEGKKWKLRKRTSKPIVARLYTVSPKNVELFHLRLLLLNVKGAKSYEDLRTVTVDNKQVIFTSFKDAAVALGIAINDEHWRITMREAVNSQGSKQIRTLFAFILGTNTPTDSLALWEEFKEYMIDDFLDKMTLQLSLNKCLCEIEVILQTHNTCCKSLGLPIPSFGDQDLVENSSTDPIADFDKFYCDATYEQRNIIDKVIAATQSSSGQIFYLDAPAGCGKTFVQAAVIAGLQKRRQSFLCGAYTGIAASLLKGSKTLHNLFGLPVPLLDTSVSSITPDSSRAINIRKASLLLIDEATMVPKAALTVINNLMQDVQSDKRKKVLPFGGKTVFMCGDPRQTLPVVPHAGRSGTIEACLQSHPFWQKIKKLSLTKNMRVNPGEAEFSEFLLKVGNDTLPKLDDQLSIFPSELHGKNEIKGAISFVYSDIKNDIETGQISEKAILAPTNEDCAKVNKEVLSLIEGDVVEYLSIDSIVADDMNNQEIIPTEYLNSIEVSGLPRHKLQLKVGTVVMLLRNLDTSSGLINGTRLRIEGMFQMYLECTVLTGCCAGAKVLIPKLKLQPSEIQFPFKMERLQFPVSLAFCMTINKSQGQSLSKVAIYLPKPVFTHGQLYVALSRSRSFEGVKIFIGKSDSHKVLGDGSFTTANVVFREIMK